MNDKDNQIVLGTSAETVTFKGELVVGVDGEYTLITREGITVDGVPIITEKANGEIHIGKNSLITTTEEKTLPNGKKVQPLYAKDGSGNLIPIDVRSKLLINGRDIEQSINNVEAMSAALTGFVWKLGKSNEPTKISMNQKKEMDLKISKLESDNKELKTKNDAIISQNAKLLARLENLENIAFALQKNEGLKLSKGL